MLKSIFKWLIFVTSLCVPTMCNNKIRSISINAKNGSTFHRQYVSTYKIIYLLSIKMV